MIFQLASGFMAAKHLFAASELGIFEALGEGPADLDRLAARTGLTRRATRISADAMVSVGLLERHGDVYENTPTADAFLSGATPADMRPLLRFWDKISFPSWIDLAGALARGPAWEIFDLDESLQPIASAGIEAFQAGPSQALPDTVDLTDRHRLLDIGGGTGSWSISLTGRYPHLEATVFELPAVAAIANERIAGAMLGNRIRVRAGDALTDELPTGFDTFLIANLAHYWSPETNRTLLQRIRNVAEPGARLLAVDFWTDPTHTQPFAAALMAGEFAVHLRDGDVYSADEFTEWLSHTGWRFLDHKPLAGPMSVIIAEAAPA
ncbi:putative methyltransferase [Gordonia rhizosphera NBRC 16068]|uniref:Putative methyltransferase n=1 Tax=Gordonia rhizosphera NBRC 16068 TaxID=1108045 RepID=K6WS63_9ACTN|nr:putative methyltransferase [Gordonia rhizosphera NBRC 16068]